MLRDRGARLTDQRRPSLGVNAPDVIAPPGDRFRQTLGAGASDDSQQYDQQAGGKPLTGATMSEWSEKAKSLMADLERERDELRVKMHLAKADAKDELEKLDAQVNEKMAELKAKIATFDKDGDGSVMDDLGDAARDLAGDIRDSFQKFRDRF